MTLPIILATDCFGYAPKAIENQSKAVQAKWLCLTAFLFVLDAIAALSSLIVGILGLTTVSTLPAIASWSLIGLGAGITLIWIIVPIVMCNRPKHQDIQLGQNLVLRIPLRT